MSHLHILSLTCNQTEDNLGEDECELRILTTEGMHTLRRDMNNGDKWDIDLIVPFEDKAKVRLYDLDSPGWPWYDDNDFLGEIVIRGVPQEITEDTFSQDDADYTIVYKVI